MNESPLKPPFLGLDHGQKFLGVALSHTGYFASPLTVIPRQSKAQDFAQLQLIIQRENVQSIVLGLPPIPPDFIGHSQADTVKIWAGHLAAAIPLPIYFWEEGFSSEDAETALCSTGKRPPERIDAHAAALILQTCLDAIREGHGLPEQFILPES